MRQIADMERSLSLMIFVCCVSGIGMAQSSNARRPAPSTYVLYAWEEPRGAWNFTLLPGEVSREFFKKEVLNRKKAIRGFEALQHRMLQLAAGSTLIWYDRVLDNGKLQHLGYPPKEIIQQVDQYARARMIVVYGPE